VLVTVPRPSLWQTISVEYLCPHCGKEANDPKASAFDSILERLIKPQGLLRIRLSSETYQFLI